MARRAPAIERCIAVLNHLAQRPDRRLTLSELARELDLNKATAHAMLNTLTDSGYLVRDPSAKTYGLGPSLIAVGSAAVAANPAIDLALPVMRDVSRECEVECVVSTVVDDEIVVLAEAGAPRPLGINVRPGQRLPLVPPLGTVFVAWAGDDAIDRWLAKVGPDAAERQRKAYRRAVEAVRQRGYSVALGGEGQQQLLEALIGAGHAPTSDDEYALLDLADDTAYTINHIGVPVFGPNGSVTLGLFLIGFRGQIPAIEVPKYAERLRDAANRVASTIRDAP